jgi:hypothetical protein
MPVAAGRTLENRPRQERLTPERDQPDRIEVSGINGPETHARLAVRGVQGVGAERTFILGNNALGRGHAKRKSAAHHLQPPVELTVARRYRRLVNTPEDAFVAKAPGSVVRNVSLPV